MKFFRYILVVVFLNYHYIHAKKFDCHAKNPWKKDNAFLTEINGKVTWNIKYLGFNNTDYYNKLLCHVVKSISKGKLTETTYAMHNSEEHILIKQIAKADIHDNYFAMHYTKMEVSLVKVNGTLMGKPYDHMTISTRDPDEDYVALIHYGLEYDFYVYQSCYNPNIAIVEVGNEILRKIASGNKALQKALDESINKVLMDANISSRNDFTEFNELLDIFQ